MDTTHSDDNRLIRFDWAMKRLLRDKANFNVLEGFLTSLLGEEIVIDELLESEGNADREDGKQNRVDLLAKDSTGRKILIEVQNQSEDQFFHRILFGTSKIINDYINRGDKYDKIDKIYSISLVYFNIVSNSDYIYHGTTDFIGIHNGEPLNMSERWKRKYKVTKISEIYPEYYILFASDFDKWSKTPIDQWMYFLSQGVVHEQSDAPGLDAAREKMRIDRLSKEERNAYYNHLESINSMHNVLENAKEEAHFEGVTEGMQMGFEKGMEKGMEKGRADEKRQIAKQMLANGIDRTIVKTITGLDDEELE